jgi:hypothetical protein
VRHDPGNRQADLPQRQQRSGSRWHQLTCKEAAQHGIKVSSSGINAAVVLLSAARSPIFLAFWCCCLRSIQTICSLSSPAFTARQALPASAPPRSPTQIDSESLGGSTHALASRAEAKPAAAEAKRSRRSSAPHCPARAAESRRSETQAKGSAETLCLFAGKALEPQTQGGLFRLCLWCCTCCKFLLSVARRRRQRQQQLLRQQPNGHGPTRRLRRRSRVRQRGGSPRLLLLRQHHHHHARHPQQLLPRTPSRWTSQTPTATRSVALPLGTLPA